MIEFINYSFQYALGSDQALHNLTLSINEGEFVLFLGPGGSGKTTLLRQLKPELKPHGISSGELLTNLTDPSTAYRKSAESVRRKSPESDTQNFKAQDLTSFDFQNRSRKSLDDSQKALESSEIAFVMQNPTTQIVMHSVWHELAFGLENQGLEFSEIERRIAEVSSFFGIESWIGKDTDELSGGEKQILNLAANIILQPKLLILDEPTSQLDPIARRDFLNLLYYLHSETGITILMSEHQLEDLLPYADQVVYLEKGEIAFAGPPREFASALLNTNRQFSSALPLASKLVGVLPKPSDIRSFENSFMPLNVQEGRAYIQQHRSLFSEIKSSPKPKAQAVPDTKKRAAERIRMQKVWFRYQPEEKLILREADLIIRDQEILAIMGGNGSGKSTLLYLLCKALKPLRGKVQVSSGKKIAMLGQNPESVFSAETVRDVLFAANPGVLTKENVDQMISLFELRDLLDRHPFDISGGEKQRLALAKVFLTTPDILLLDEPAKSLDSIFKKKLVDLLRQLRHKMALVIVTHDVEFASQVADRVAMLFNQKVIAEATMQKFFSMNHYYTTAAYRLSRGTLPGILPEFVQSDELLRYFQQFSDEDSRDFLQTHFLSEDDTFTESSPHAEVDS